MMFQVKNLSDIVSVALVLKLSNEIKGSKFMENN